MGKRVSFIVCLDHDKGTLCVFAKDALHLSHQGPWTPSFHRSLPGQVSHCGADEMEWEEEQEEERTAGE